MGGILAQLIMRKYPGKGSGFGLYSTCCLAEGSLKGLKKQYSSYGVMLALMKVLPYSWIRKMLIAMSKKMVGLGNEAQADRNYMEDFFVWVYENYTKEHDIHMTSLMISLAGINPITGREYQEIDKNALLVLPTDDKAFPEEAQRELINYLPNAMIARVSGGHTAVLYKVDSYVESTRRFLEERVI